ncbi:hypothetical protein Q8A67_001629 [Cirrhinus molitorella]|uniref:Uncharacterized protein n=1 Tax=Cirrhinus molitorella TaxID=172907 RepID=A0AA88QBH5_9TELE|nr:hypothetical protein Q8A67_001629 [Cirrhinus molitorella]
MKKLYKCLWILLGFLLIQEVVNGQEGENVAFLHTTTQSSMYGTWYSEYAVDGVRDSCSHTETQNDPWWRVDLLKVYRVNRVAITNRLSYFSYRINGAVIRVGNSPNVYSNPICTVIPTIPSGATANFSCGAMEGRYVIIHIPGNGMILTLCEVEVYRYLGENGAMDRTATQSSTLDDWFPEKAIDGNKALYQPFTGCSSTLTETNPWWRLDLHQVYRVSKVVITNRKDCCPERINGAEIHIGNSLENNGNDNPICAVISAIPAGESYNHSCGGMDGRYVNLIIPGDMKMLTLCEVEVYGEGPVLKRSFVKIQFNSRVDLTDTSIGENVLIQLGSALADRGFTNVTLCWFKSPKREVTRKVNTPIRFLLIEEMATGQEENAALWGNTSESSDYGNWLPTHAIDGVLTTWAHTKLETDPWWRVDLLKVYRVNRVTITNRNDFAYRINGAVIRVGNFLDVYSNAICGVISTLAVSATATFSCGGMVGRYVVIHIPGNDKFLTLAEVGVYGYLAGNRAVGGAVIQSSTSGNWFAEKAIDSNRGFQQLYTGCSLTNNETNPWWRLDLHEVYRVNEVVITNRKDCCADRINGAEIRIGNSLENNGNDNPICAVIPAIPAGESYSYSCGGMEGRYINLIIPGDMKMLTLCEVKVYGEGPCLKRSFVKILFNSSKDLTDSATRESVLKQLGSALADRGLTDVTLRWSQTPKRLIQKVNAVKESPDSVFILSRPRIIDPCRSLIVKTSLLLLLLAALMHVAFSVHHEFVYVPTRVNWTNAQKYCREHYTDLATTDDQADHDELLKTGGKAAFWIGLSRTTTTGVFVWSDQSSSSFTKWRSGQPNGQLCVDVEADRKREIVRLEVKSSLNLNDPAVMNEILMNMEHILKQKGLNKLDYRMRESVPFVYRYFHRDFWHASICGDGVLQTIDANAPTCGTSEHSQSSDIKSLDDVLSLLARRVEDSKDFKICMSRTDFFQRAMVQWQWQKKGTLRVTFLGEAGVDSGAIRKEFLTRLQERCFLLVLCKVDQPPRFLRKWCFDYLSTGDVDEANLTKDDVDDAELFELIQKVEEETDLSAWTDDIISCGFTGTIKPENKEAIIR